MSPFSHIIEMIDQQLEQPEYWSEYGLPSCIGLVQRMTALEWESLRQFMLSKSANLQSRAVNCAAYGDPKLVIPWLIDAILWTQRDVMVRVLESLSEFPPTLLRSYLANSDLKVIEELVATLTGLDKRVGENVLRYIQS